VRDWHRWGSFVGVLALAGCGNSVNEGATAVVARASVVTTGHSATTPAASVEERFGLGPPPMSSDDRVQQASAMLRWDLPAGWVERPPTSMRIANFLAAGDAEAECYLTVLPGEAGGLGANVNRWLAQLAQPGLSPAQLDALPRAKLLDRDAVLLEAEGTFTGMSATTSKAGQKLLGLLFVDPDGSAFLKLVGPGAIVTREREAFLALARSMRPAGADGAQAGTETALSSEPYDAAGTVLSSESNGATRVERAAGLVVHVPSNWERVPEKPPRALDLRVEDDVECSITVLGGEGGGARANIDRWRGQLGLAPMTDDEFAQLDRVKMLGADALKVWLAGTAAHGGRAILGVLCVAPDRSVFVKLTGPGPRLAAHAALFHELCRTLEDA